MKKTMPNPTDRPPSPTLSDRSLLSDTQDSNSIEDQERLADANMRHWLKKVLFLMCLISLPTSGFLIYDDIQNHNKDETELTSGVALLGAAVLLTALIAGGLACQRRLERNRLFSSPSASRLLPGGDLELGKIEEESSPSTSFSLSPRSTLSD